MYLSIIEELIMIVEPNRWTESRDKQSQERVRTLFLHMISC